MLDGMMKKKRMENKMALCELKGRVCPFCSNKVVYRGHGKGGEVLYRRYCVRDDVWEEIDGNELRLGNLLQKRMIEKEFETYAKAYLKGGPKEKVVKEYIYEKLQEVLGKPCEDLAERFAVYFEGYVRGKSAA